MAKVLDLFNEAADNFNNEYMERRNVLSYPEYLAEMAGNPRIHIRDAARYTLDAIDYFGSYDVERPWGKDVRYKIFDQEFSDSSARLVGQEKPQAAVRDAIASQVRDGRINRLILIHGPNGSAKSTLAASVFRGLEHYSRIDEGIIYRFRWVFPTRTTSQGKLGFGSRIEGNNLESFAHLEDEEIDSMLDCEVRDHPLLLLPKSDRITLIEKVLDDAGHGDYQIPDFLKESSLCHRCRQVADALMRTHQGDLRKVLAHVQVERWAMSRRYCRGIATVGPQMSADASQRQVTADRSLAALPIELQNMTLFDTVGPLVDGSGGIVEFEDMLKRSIDAFKYLLNSIETGEVLLGQSILRLNTILMATTNDLMLEAFRDHHEYPSFRDRLEMVPVPYITQYKTEAKIYELQLVSNIGKHMAPHAVDAAALWAVLSRLHKPNHENYPEELREIIKDFTVGQKAELYEEGDVPADLDANQAAALKDALIDMRQEDAGSWSYEGRYGASPRLIRQVLLSASLADEFICCSPFAVLDKLDEMRGRTRELPFLDKEAQAGGYHDTKTFSTLVEKKILDGIEDDIRTASGLVEESRYLELMNKYVSHVSHSVKDEKVLSATTGIYEDADENMMKSVEETLIITEKAEEHRKNFISKIAAWAIENPGQKVKAQEIFPEYLQRIKTSYFEEHRHNVAKIAKLALIILTKDDKGPKLDEEDKALGDKMIKELTKDMGYCQECARDSLAQLFARRQELDS